MAKILIDALPLGSYQANCFIVRNEGEKNCMIVDPGDDVPRLKKALAQLDLTPEVIFLTHAHFDHMIGAAHIQKAFGCKIAVSEEDSACLYDRNVNIMPTVIDTKLLETRADEFVGPGTWHAAGMEFTVLATPGHTKGGLCLLNEENRFLISGDTLFAEGFGRTDLPGGSWSELLISLRRLLALDENITVYSGHGPASDIGRIRKVLYA